MKLEDGLKDWRTGSSTRLAPNESFSIADGSYQMHTLMKQAKVLLFFYFNILMQDGILEIHNQNVHLAGGFD